MSVKLSRYSFHKIAGQIVPVRKGLKRASSAINELVEKALKTKVSFKTGEPSKKAILGRGIDFNVWADDKHSMVLKIPRNKVGTSNNSFIKKWPELADKVAIHKTAGDNLPNYGIPTVPSESIRLTGKKKGLIQEFSDSSSPLKQIQWLKNEADSILKKTGLKLDIHHGNVSNKGYLVDTGLNLKGSKISQVKYSDQAKEMLGVDDSWGSNVKDNLKPDLISERAILEGQSKGALAKLNALKKKGWKFVPKFGTEDEYRLINPIPTKAEMPKDVRFIRKNGKIIPIRVKTGKS